MAVYKHGLPFEPILYKNLERLNKRVQEDKKAALIIIGGGVGLGKTTLLIHILDAINKMNGINPVVIKSETGDAGPQIAMGGAEFLKKLRVCYDQKLPCMGYDEAGDFSKRGSLTSFNAMINRTFETFRAFKCLVVLALPNFNVLDNQLFDNQIPRMLVQVSGRTNTYGNFGGYGLMEMNWLRYHMKRSAIKDYAWQKVHANFRGHFLDLDPERSQQLDTVSTSNKLKILRKAEIKAEGLVSYSDMSERIGLGVQSIQNYAKRLNIKPVKIIEGLNYYTTDSMNQICDFLETRNEDRVLKSGRKSVKEVVMQ